MNTIQFSHECPVDILKHVDSLNDYHYVLHHLWDIPEYRDFFMNQTSKTNKTKETKEMYLDNSAFEFQFLDTDFDLDSFYDNIKELKPDVVIVPDVLDDYFNTIKNAERFDYEKILAQKSNTKFMGVLQGETIEQLLICYDAFETIGLDYIAIPFHSGAYQNLKETKETKEVNDAKGRPLFVEFLSKTRIIRPKSLHLIGMSLPQEKEYFNQLSRIKNRTFNNLDNPGLFKYIKSIDTANPIKYALSEGEYPPLEEITHKPHYILDHERMTRKTSRTELNTIKHNIQKFQDFWTK